MTILQSLDVWLDGFPEPAGRLDKADDLSLAFHYSPAFLEHGPHALSLALPLSTERVGDADARAFFGNLLPENDQMQRIVDRARLERGDVVGILALVGADCPGAISCLPEGSPPAKVPGVLAEDYRLLKQREIEEIVRSLAERQRLPDDVSDPSPVAGVQRKIALTVLEDGRYALPSADRNVPTTHILKVPSRQDASDVANEAAAATLAASVNLDVVIPEPIDVGGFPALLIERFDRRIVDGVVYRVHQEDFAQALGLPPALKYERNATSEHRFDLTAVINILDRSRDPARARMSFLRTTLFNLAIGNTDNHAKNQALLYSGGAVPVLAPLYDLLPIRLNDRYTHEFAFEIGRAKYFDHLTTADLEAFFRHFGLEGPRMRRFVERDLLRFLLEIDEAAAALPRPALKRFDDLVGRELAVLGSLLGLDLDLRERDAFQPRAGGWLAS